MAVGTSSAARLFDGILSCEAGVDSGKSPTVATQLNPMGLARNQVSFATNTTMRGGRFKPRPGLKKVAIGTFDQVRGRFQGATAYVLNNEGSLVAAIDGHFLRFNVGSDNSVVDITPLNDPNPPNRPIVWFYQAEKFLIGQDGQSLPFIYDGGNSRRAGADEVPTGTVGAYSKGRIWQAKIDQTFVAGNLVYTDGTVNSVLKFTENDFLNEGGSFAVSGDITAMCPVATIDTSLGQGPLLVFTNDSVYTVDAPYDRTTWKNLQNPIETVSLISYGATSQYSTVLVNGDVFFRAPDGVRSFMVARREFGQWSNTQISREMNRVILRDDKFLLDRSNGVLFDNRLLMTHGPVNTSHGVYHRGLMALDFDLISGMAYKSPPAWEGTWNGINILQIVTVRIRGTERCFMFALSDENEIELWELTLDGQADLMPEETPIVRTIEFGSYSFNKPFQLKRLESGDIWIDELSGNCDFVLEYRPDQYPCWFPWFNWSECAKNKDCDTPQCGTPIEYKPQYRPRRRFPSPEQECNETADLMNTDGYEFQSKLTITGFCEVKQFRLQVFERTEPMVGEC